MSKKLQIVALTALILVLLSLCGLGMDWMSNQESASPKFYWLLFQLSTTFGAIWSFYIAILALLDLDFNEDPRRQLWLAARVCNPIGGIIFVARAVFVIYICVEGQCKLALSYFRRSR